MHINTHIHTHTEEQIDEFWQLLICSGNSNPERKKKKKKKREKKKKTGGLDMITPSLNYLYLISSIN